MRGSVLFRGARAFQKSLRKLPLIERKAHLFKIAVPAQRAFSKRGIRNRADPPEICRRVLAATSLLLRSRERNFGLYSDSLGAN
jgi:hypothetical protein